MSSAAFVKPSLRGVSHHFAAVAALAAGSVLVAAAPPGRAAWASAVYSAALVLLFAASALYHRPTWAPRARAWLRRLDHACIFVLIAGTYTPVCLLALRGEVGHRLLIGVWGGAALGVCQSLFWVQAPKLLSTALYLLLGWALLPHRGAIAMALGGPGSAWLAGGGLLYSVGAAVYALRRPNPAPRVFGYHEIFHALVVAAAVCHFSAVFLLVSRSPS